MNQIILDAPMNAMKNKQSLKDICGCFHCIKTFDVSEIKDWTDNNETAICPYCDRDSCISVNEKKLLTEIHEYWFKKK